MYRRKGGVHPFDPGIHRLDKDYSGPRAPLNDTSTLISWGVSAALPVLAPDMGQVQSNFLLLDACRNGDVTHVRRLIEKRGNIGLTPVMWASYFGHTDIVKLLIENKAIVDTCNKNGRTASFFASCNSHTGVVKLLTDNKVTEDICDQDGQTASLTAEPNDHLKVVKLFRNNENATVTNCDKDGGTVFQSSSQNGHALQSRVPADDQSCRTLSTKAHTQSEASHSHSVDTININQIEFGNTIGSGSYGDVWEAYLQGRTVAVKKFNRAGSVTFQREYVQLKDLDHPNIVNVLHIAWTKEDLKLCLVMEYAADGSLHSTLHRPGQTKTALPQVISWGCQCAEGVAYLHSRSIVHRDLKPRNALLFKDKTVLKICDFGTARDVPPSADGEHSEQIMTRGIGTLPYIAPEVLNGSLYSKKCDVYSWAIVMWEITTCRTPYEEDVFQNLRKLKMQGKTPSPIEGLPVKLIALIMSSWAFNSSERPAMAKVAKIMRDLNCPN